MATAAGEDLKDRPLSSFCDTAADSFLYDVERDLAKDTDEKAAHEEKGLVDEVPVTVIGEPVLIIGPIANRANLSLMEKVYSEL